MAENTAVKNESKEAQLAKASRMNMIRSILPVVGLVGIFLLFNILTGGGMVKSKNLLLSQVYVTVISAMGVFFIMTMGGLDFSQGSIMGMASIAVCMLSKYNIVLAILGGILTGAVIGAFNGFFYVNRKIKSFIVTICSMFLFRGVIKYLASDAPVAASMKVYDFDNMPFKLTLTLIVLVIGFVIFRFTKFGMYLKAIGAGEKAAMFAGIRTDRMKFLIYVLSGAITGLAAFLNVAKNGSATANAGNQLETQIQRRQERLRYRKRRQPAGDPDPDRPGTGRHAHLGRCQGPLLKYRCRFHALRSITERTADDGYVSTDPAADPGCCIPGIRSDLRRPPVTESYQVSLSKAVNRSRQITPAGFRPPHCRLKNERDLSWKNYTLFPAARIFTEKSVWNRSQQTAKKWSIS